MLSLKSYVLVTTALALLCGVADISGLRRERDVPLVWQGCVIAMEALMFAWGLATFHHL